MEDGPIIDLYLERQEEAISFTSEKYGRRLRRISMRIVEDLQTAEECENDTYMQAWNRIPPSEPYGYLFAFLARITRHISIDVCRKRTALRRDAMVVELTEEMAQCIPANDDPAAEVDKRLLAERISGYLHGLPKQKREVFLRRYWYMDAVAEIAADLHLSESKVKMTLLRCRKELRTHLAQGGYHV